MLQEINARVSNGTLIEWGFDPEYDRHVIKIIDDNGTWSLNPRNGREAIDMFQHTFTYDWNDDMSPDNYVYDVERCELVPRATL